jgi:DNA mismatch repair protein PMS2
LANISTSLIIATRTAQDTLADKLEFRTDGSLKEDAVAQVPRKIGTTVAVLGLMQRLPVRRRDLEQRIQYHRAKLVSLISSYAIFTTGVRIHLMDMVQDAARKSFRESTVLATPPNSFSFAETVSSVLGAKFLSGMVEISFDISSIVTKDEESQKYGRQCKIHGLVSKAGIVAREQRGVKQSQQYLSINRRPVDMPKSMVRVLNECFRRCSNSDRMAPSCVLEIVLPNSEFDINLSPDKRQVLLVNEAELCEIMRTELTKFWSSQTAIGANSNSETIQRHFLCNDISGTSGEYENNNENEGDEDDEPAEAEESFSGTRMCPQRRFAFVHDPTQSVEKERLEENRRLEYKQQRRRTSLDGENQQQNLELRFEDAAAAVAAEERSLMQNKTMRSSPENDFVPQLPHEFPCAEATCINLHAFRLQNQRPILMNVTQSSPNENLITPPPRSEIHGKVALDSHLPWSERQQFRQVQAQFNSVKDNKGEMASSLEICEETCSEENGKSSGRTKSVQPKKRPSFGLERFGFRSLQEETKKRRVVNHADDPYCGKQQDLDKTAVAVRQPASVLLEDYTKNDTMRRSRPQTATRAVTSGSAETSSDSAFASAETATESTSTQTTFPTHFKTWASYDHDSSTSDIIVSAMRDRTAMRDRRRKFSTKRKYVRIDSSLPESSSLTSGVDAAEAATSDEHKETTCKKGTVSLTKTDLESLEIIGQFNLGFILARSEDGNLWILDQHACDERSNFEKLSNETIFHEQKLIAPMRMELSPLQESTIQNNIEIFEANGFRFLYDENTLPQHRFSLIAVPHR